MKITNIILLALMLSIVGCDPEEPSNEPLVYSITIHEPNLDDKNVGDVMHIHVDFDEANEQTIHHIRVQIKNKADGTIIYNAPASGNHVMESSGHYEHHADFSLAVDPDTDWIVEATVWGHEAGSAEITESIEFHVNP